MARDIRKIPPTKLRKRELRELITYTRLRHDDQIRRLLSYMEPEIAAKAMLDEAKRLQA